MSITTVDGLIKGMVPPIYTQKGVAVAMTSGIAYNLSPASGMPGGMATSTAGLSGEIYSGNAPGTLYWPRPATGKAYIVGMNAQVSQPGTLLLCDMLWRNSGLSTAITTPQTVNSIPWPARDKDYTTLGKDVFVGVEVTTASTAGTPTLTTTFTASDGTTGNTTANEIPTVAVSNRGFLYTPDTLKLGMRSVQSFTLSSAWTSAVISLIAYRVLSRIEIPLANTGFSINFPFNGLESLPTDSSLIWVFIPATGSSARVFASLLLATG